MPDSRTVIEHLLDSRDALLLEVTRLTMAINELDSVIVRIGGDELRSRLTAAPVPAVHTTTVPASAPTPPEPVNPPAEVEAESPATPRRAIRTAPSRKQPAPAAGRRSPATVATGTGQRTAVTKAPLVQRVSAAPPGQKSIRVHVLDMLAAENRDFGLAEIIERIHAYGIAAHDDAVRSITIKLMKDGKVERVGRGQYRLARRSTARAARTERVPAAAVTEPATAEPAVTEPAVTDPAMTEPAVTDPTVTDPDGDAADAPEPTYTRSTDDLESAAEAGPTAIGTAGTHRTIDAGQLEAAASEPSNGSSVADQPSVDAQPPVSVQAYPPPLNLAQPWDRSNR